MTVKVNEDCISCGMCINMCPDVFDYNKDGLSHVVGNPDNCPNAVEAAAEACPTNAIEIIQPTTRATTTKKPTAFTRQVLLFTADFVQILKAVYSAKYISPVGGCCGCRRRRIVVAASVLPIAVKQQYYKGNNQPRSKRQFVVLIQNGVQQQ